MLAEAEGSPDLTANEQNAAAIAKRLLEDLKRAGPTSDAEIRAMEVLERQTHVNDPREKYRIWQVQLTQLRGMYNEEVNSYKAKGEEPPLTFEQYLDRTVDLYGFERVEDPDKKGE